MAFGQAEEGGPIMWTIKRSIAFAAIPLAFAAPTLAGAYETSFYVGNTWSIALHSDNATATNPPYCSMRTTNWAGKAIAINIKLTALDEVTPEVVFEKASWGLPVGETTSVRFGIYNGGILEFPAMAVSETTLQLKPNAGDVFYKPFVLKTAEILLDFRGNLQIAAGFKGDEKSWIGNALESGEKYSLKAAFDECNSTLRKLGPSIFPEALSSSPTSPFAPSTGNNTPPKWEFSKREEDWGETCYVEKKQGDILVGFMKARDHDLEGFVENGFSGSVKTSWIVDNNPPITSEGDVTDYFGWHSFSGFDNDFLIRMESGKKLTIKDDKGKVINFDLNGALTAFWDFATCSRAMDDQAASTNKR